MPTVRTAQDLLTDARKVSADYYKHTRPFIFGPLAKLHRYSNGDEKQLINLGDYDTLNDAVYTWPNKTSGSLIDLGYVKVFMEDVLLEYFTRFIGVGSAVAPVANYSNRVRAASKIFKTTTNAVGTTFTRSSELNDRDVAIGDTVRVRGTVSAVSYEHTSSVIGFVPEVIAASIAAATSDAANKITQTLSTTINQVQNGKINEVVATASGAAYEGTPTGDISETYTITVIQASTASNATTARLRVRSASGNDDQESVTPVAFGSPTSIGTRGLTVTFALTGGPGASAGAISAGLDPNDLLVGQEWVCSVAQAFTAPTSTSGGTFTGTQSLCYIIEVTRGGAYAGSVKPQISCYTTTGADISGPTNITASGSPFPVGTLGVTVQFNQSKLCKGDRYHINATGPQEGAVRTLILANSLPVGLQPATDLDIHLYIPKTSLQIDENRITAPPNKNWTAVSASLTVKEAITVYESSWTSSGTLLPLPISEGTVFAEYREWLVSDAGTVFDISDITAIDSLIDGQLDPDNPLKYAVYKALQQTQLTNLGGNTTEADKVRYAILGGDPEDETLDPWEDVLELVSGMDQIYTLVPLTFAPAVFSLVKAHVDAQSTAEVGANRAAIFCLQAKTSDAVVDENNSSDSATVLATIVQNPAVVSTAFTKVYVAAGNADFITNGVTAGDIVRAQFTTDGFGNESWTEYEVASVESEDILLLESGPGSAIGTAQKIEIWRNFAPASVASNLVSAADLYSSSRIVCVFPDIAGLGGSELSGYHLCAAIAGQMGSVPSHQGLTNTQLLGFDDVSRSMNFFNNPQRDTLTNGGIWVVAQLPNSGLVYTKRAVTSDPSSLSSFEEMKRRNADEYYFLLLDKWGQYTGNANNTPGALESMRTAFISLTGELQGKTSTQRLGSMILSAGLDTLRQHVLLADHVVASITFVGPDPLNKVDLTVVI